MASSRLCVALLIFGALAPLSRAQAQGRDSLIILGTETRVRSEVLKEDRRILVRVPASYRRAGGTDRYPVLYVLDGDTHIEHASSTVEFLATGQSRMPEMIVVAIPNTDRIRDLAPPGETIRNSNTAGDAFLRFLTDELFPFIDGRYRTQPYRVLLGHSRGGLFNIYTLLEKPDAFQAHIAASPFEGWNRGLLHQRALREITRVPNTRFLYLTTGEEEQGFAIRDATEELVAHLRKHPGQGPTWHYEVLKGESHNSTPLRTLYDGLTLLFAGWAPNAEAARTPAGISAHYEALSKKFVYAVRPPATVLNTLGNGMIQRNQVDSAVAVFRQAVDYYPQNRYLYESLSRAYEAGQQWRDAHAAYQRAFELARPTLSGAALARFEERLATLRGKLPARQ